MSSRTCIFTLGILIVFGFSAQRPGATYLLIPVGARQSSMAYAFTAVADDASANYYNAAGLAFLDSPQVTGTYVGYLLGLHHDMHHIYVAAAYPFGKSCIGLDFTYFTPGNVEVVNTEGVYLGRYVMWRIAPKISYARRFGKKLALGLSWKFIKQQYATYWWWDPWLGSNGLDRGGTGVSFAFDLNYFGRIWFYEIRIV